jgi:hypothetical protein
MPNARIETDIVGLVVVPGCSRTLTVNVVNPNGTKFDLTGYAVKAKVEVGTVETTITGTITSAIDGTSTVEILAATSTDWPAARNGVITLYADPTAGVENVHISTVLFRTSTEVVP